MTAPTPTPDMLSVAFKAATNAIQRARDATAQLGSALEPLRKQLRKAEYRRIRAKRIRTRGWL